MMKMLTEPVWLSQSADIMLLSFSAIIPKMKKKIDNCSEVVTSQTLKVS